MPVRLQLPTMVPAVASAPVVILVVVIAPVTGPVTDPVNVASVPLLPLSRTTLPLVASMSPFKLPVTLPVIFEVTVEANSQSPVNRPTRVAVPVPVPTPDDVNTVPAVLLAEPISVKSVVPGETILYRLPLIKLPAFTVGLVPVCKESLNSVPLIVFIDPDSKVILLAPFTAQSPVKLPPVPAAPVVKFVNVTLPVSVLAPVTSNVAGVAVTPIFVLPAISSTFLIFVIPLASVPFELKKLNGVPLALGL